jgi:hypothetical protein
MPIKTAGLVFAEAQTIPFWPLLAETLGVAPGYPKLLLVSATGAGKDCAFLN